MKEWMGAFLVIAIGALVAACSAGGRRLAGDGGTGPEARADSGTTEATDAERTPGEGVGPSRDATATADPFDPESSCGASAIETERLPGQVLLVFDRSSSMDSTPGGSSSTRWTLANDAINSVLGSLPDELGTGLMLFPSVDGGDECTVSAEPQVPVNPLSAARGEIERALEEAEPTGGVTPIVDATRKGWAHLEALDAPGQRGLVVVTDGAETCAAGEQDALLSEAEDHLEAGHLTFVVGLTTTNNFLSTLADKGGTRRSEDCKPVCTTPQCFGDGDCPGSASCFQILPSEPGLCGCNSDADCIAPQTCMPLPLIGGECIGDGDCCHYNATESRFESDFEEALSEIARRFLDSCVFEVPKEDPDDFDADHVNVGVTFEGEDRTVLPRGDDADVDSWSYTDDGQDSIVIQGPICDRLQSSAATVEIVVGCPSILI